MNKTYQWKPLKREDAESVFSIAEQIHSLHERKEVFEEKIRLFPEGCRGLYADNTLTGYGIAHPWKLYAAPHLDDYIQKLPENPSCMYIHDAALLPYMRGKGLMHEYISYVKVLAEDLKIETIALVSVYGTAGFWSRQGFASVDEQLVKTSLDAYGESAVYMVCRI